MEAGLVSRGELAAVMLDDLKDELPLVFVLRQTLVEVRRQLHRSLVNIIHRLPLGHDNWSFPQIRDCSLAVAVASERQLQALENVLRPLGGEVAQIRPLECKRPPSFQSPQFLPFLLSAIEVVQHLGLPLFLGLR